MGSGHLLLLISLEKLYRFIRGVCSASECPQALGCVAGCVLVLSGCRLPWAQAVFHPRSLGSLKDQPRINQQGEGGDGSVGRFGETGWGREEQGLCLQYRLTYIPKSGNQ